MIFSKENISELLIRLNTQIKERLFDSEGYILPECLVEIIDPNEAAKDLLLTIIKDKSFSIKCDNLENYLYSLAIYTKVFDQETIISHTKITDNNLFASQLLDQDKRDLQSFFKTIPKGFLILINLLKSAKDNKAIIQFLLKFKDIDSFLDNKILSLTVNKIQEFLTPLVNRGDPQISSKLREFLKTNQHYFPILSKKVNSTFIVNKYITLKLENGVSNIYVAGRIFNQCKYLFLNVSSKNADYYKYVESIDEATEVSRLSNALEGNRHRNKYQITPETEFWGHCSNIQAWVENGYDTRILHRNLAFPLLKRLTEVGDPIAQKVFKSEILNRLISGHQTVISYLTSGGYLKYLEKEDYDVFFSKMDLDVLERLFRGMGNQRHFTHVKRIFDKLRTSNPASIEDSIVNLIEVMDIELFQGLRKSNSLELVNQEKLIQLIAKESCQLKDFCYEFRSKLCFINHDLSLKLSRKGLKSFKEIVGLHRLKPLKLLDVSNNEINELYGLENLSNLTILKIGGNPLPESLIRELGGIDNNGNARIPLNFVKYCKEYANHDFNVVYVLDVRYEAYDGKLDLSNKGISHISELKGIEKLKGITSLNLSNNRLTDLIGIEQLTSLQNLNLCNNQLTNINGIETLKNLQVLRVHGNEGLKVPNLSELNQLTVLDVSTPRKLQAKTYLKYLVQLFTINELNGICRRFSLLPGNKCTREGLITQICESLEDFNIRDVIRDNERRIVSIGLKEALLFIKKLKSELDKEKLLIKLIHDTLIEAIFNYGKNAEFRSILDLKLEEISDPIRMCDCTIGQKKGFCSHFWVCLIFAFKLNLISLQDWNLTILPKNFKDLLKTFEAIPINNETFYIINTSDASSLK